MNTLIMGSYTDVKNLIISNIKANGQREITGPILQDVLLNMLENSSRVEEITYSDLKALRDEKKLTPSRLYRITDYVTTTVQANTKSAEHLFDVIVIALSETELLEQAWAIQHEGDDYFANSNLSTWKIWYCLDNDTARFAWADGTNGKGVIYRMIDEWNNDIPYDFKNIQFYRKWDSAKGLWSTVSTDGKGVLCYTFNPSGSSSTTEFTDVSLSSSNSVYSNTIKEYVVSNKQNFNNNCFFGYSCNCNDFGNGCYNNAFGESCRNNAFGNNCNYNSFGESCRNNAFGNDCNYNVFGNSCDNNAFGNDCSSNAFGNDCYNIKFASDNSASTKYNYYRYNHFGDGCAYILFKGAETASSAAQVQNYNFTQGLQGTSSAYLTIDGVRNRAYETYISKDTDGVIKESVIAEKLDKIVEITYADLVALRDAAKLIPGQQYRITDYECTTIQDGTRSAGHPFDIIVTADDVNILNEVARAIKHEGDAYFANNDLNAWQIWYSLDNDTTRFAWAMMKGKYIGVTVDELVLHVRYAETKVINDVTYDLWSTGEPGLYVGTKTLEVGEYCDLISVEDGNFVVSGENFARISDIKEVEDGKGVIYRMIDEFGNDCPYDFKNIQFYRRWDEDKQLWSTASDGAGVPCYTFSSEGDSSATQFTDTSLLADSQVYANIIKAYSPGVQILNNNCFFGDGCYCNTFGNDCYDNTFGNSCHNNAFGNDCNSNIFGRSVRNSTFGNGCYDNTFGNNCYSNVFEHECYDNAFGESCHNNAFGNGCNNNTFGDSCGCNHFESYCYNNTFGNHCDYNHFGSFCTRTAFGNNCQNNAFGNDCYNNRFGNDCSNNSLGGHCDNNAFGNDCYSNAFGNDCDNNAFGDGCYSNSFGNSCRSNAFGNSCARNSFGNSCTNIKFASDSSASTKYNYYQGNHFGDCCWYIIFTGTSTASYNNLVQNYNFSQGLQGTSSAYLTIDGVRNRAYETYISKDTDGVIKESVIAEFENRLGNCVDLTTEQTINAAKTFSAGIDLNGTRISKVGSPVNTDDAANKEYVDSQIKVEVTARTEADTELQTQINGKQEALTLTVKDNGNIVLANIQGQSKEFMPATPSGDPMHYIYIAAGAEYNNTGADIVKTAPWADLADDDADKTVIHKAGYWYLNGLGDITNEQMRVIFIETNNFMEDISYSAQARYCQLISRTHINPPIYHITASRLRVEYMEFTRDSKNLESIIFPVYKPSVDYCFRPKKISYAFSYCPNLKYVYGIINLCDCTEQTNIFLNSPNIRICQLNKLKLNLNINNLDSISSKSILYMIQNEEATSPITITLHADVYNRCMANADILAALQAHTNISLASA